MAKDGISKPAAAAGGEAPAADGTCNNRIDVNKQVKLKLEAPAADGTCNNRIDVNKQVKLKLEAPAADGTCNNRTDVNKPVKLKLQNNTTSLNVVHLPSLKKVSYGRFQLSF